MEKEQRYKLYVYQSLDDALSVDPYIGFIRMDEVRHSHLLELLPVMAKCGLAVIVSPCTNEME